METANFPEQLLRADLQAGWEQGLQCLMNLGNRHDLPELTRTATGLVELLQHDLSEQGGGFHVVCSIDVGLWSTIQGRIPYISNPSTAAALALVPEHRADFERFTETRGATPGILLNLAVTKDFSRHQRQSTLFHELLHHAGREMGHPRNPDEFDFVDTAQSCCFGARRNEDPARLPPLSMTDGDRSRFPELENEKCTEFLHHLGAH